MPCVDITYYSCKTTQQFCAVFICHYLIIICWLKNSVCVTVVHVKYIHTELCNLEIAFLGVALTSSLFPISNSQGSCEKNCLHIQCHLRALVFCLPIYVVIYIVRVAQSSFYRNTCFRIRHFKLKLENLHSSSSLRCSRGDVIFST